MCAVTLASSSLSCTQLSDCSAFRRLKGVSNPMCGAQIIVTQLYSTDCGSFKRPKRVRNPTYDVAFESSSLSCTQLIHSAFSRLTRDSTQ